MNDRFINNDTIKAVYSDDLDRLLESQGVMNDFADGKLKCKYCEKIITKQNLFAIIPEGNNVSFCCDAPECTEEMINEASQDDANKEKSNTEKDMEE